MENPNANQEEANNVNDSGTSTAAQAIPPPTSTDEQSDKFNAELDGIEDEGRKAFRDERYHHAFDRFRQGLKSIADIFVLMDRDKNNDGDDDDDDDSDGLNEDKILREIFKERQRRFAVNAAAACVRIRHWTQGLEVCRLVLEEIGPSDALQMQKATYRAGLCCRGLGDLEQAERYFEVLLAMDGVDDLVRRDARRQLKETKGEKKSNKEFAQKIMRGSSKDGRLFEEMKYERKERGPDELVPELSDEEEEVEVVEEEKQAPKVETGPPTPPPPPKILMSETDCVAALEELTRRYAQKDVQAAIKKATEDHAYEMTKGFIIRSFRILSPLQKDVYEQYGFGKSGDFDEKDFAKEYEAHKQIKFQFERAVRYLAKDNETIREKADLCHRLALGGDGGLLDAN